MSKWINKDLFDEFQQDKVEERETKQGGNGNRMDTVWRTPEKGTVDIPKVYEVRFLPTPKGEFYKKYFYHMFQSGENWVHVMCPKSFDFNNYCPLCSAVSGLYRGTAADKKQAYQYKRKEKFISNIFVVDDPRDAEAKDEGRKVTGEVRLYEFPGKVEIKLKEEITDKKNGLGVLIFDPSEEGYTFILKVLSTKKDPKTGNVWPDYANSQFARRSSSIGSNKEIDVIMSKTIDINKYLEDQLKTDDEIEEILKSEMLYDMVKDEINKYKMPDEKEEVEDDIPEFSTGREEKKEEKKDDEDMSDAELLKELDNL